jgi:hypothetical protein
MPNVREQLMTTNSRAAFTYANVRPLFVLETHVSKQKENPHHTSVSSPDDLDSEASFLSEAVRLEVDVDSVASREKYFW